MTAVSIALTMCRGSPLWLVGVLLWLSAGIFLARTGYKIYRDLTVQRSQDLQSAMNFHGSMTVGSIGQQGGNTNQINYRK